MTKLKNYLRVGMNQDIKTNLEKCASQLLAISSTVPVRPVDDFVGYSGQRIIRYVAGQVSNASSAVGTDITLFAWRTRNILEGLMLLKFVLLEEKNARAFLAQKIGDEVTILEGVLGLETDSTDDVSPVIDRIEKGKKLISKHGFEKATPWRMDFLSAQVGMSKEYNAFYKLFSKYVHPSSWTISSDKDEYENELYWQTFLINAQLYSHLTCAEGNELLKSRGSNEIKSG